MGTSVIYRPMFASSTTLEDINNTFPINTTFLFYFSGYPAVLIAIGCIVFASSIIAITYILILYKRYLFSRFLIALLLFNFDMHVFMSKDPTEWIAV